MYTICVLIYNITLLKNISPYIIGPKNKLKSKATPIAATACELVLEALRNAKIWSVKISIRGSKRGIQTVFRFCS